MVLQYDEKTHKTFNNDGVEVRVPGFGNTTTVEYLGDDYVIGRSALYFHEVVETLVNQLGYQRGANIHGAPYDFRKAASTYLFLFLIYILGTLVPFRSLGSIMYFPSIFY